MGKGKSYTKTTYEFDFDPLDWADLSDYEITDDEAAYLAALTQLDEMEGMIPFLKDWEYDEETHHFTAEIIWREGTEEEIEWYKDLRDSLDLEADESESDSTE